MVYKQLNKAIFLYPLFLLLPTITHAGFFSFMSNEVNSPAYASYDSSEANSQNLTLVQAAINIDPNPNIGKTSATVVSGTALFSEIGPSGTVADVQDHVPNTQISTYTVQKGDSVASISKMFKVSINTILWANDITGKNLREGQVLIILPISGIQHVVKKGDTLESIVKKYKADMNEVLDYNNINAGSTLSIGDFVIVPDAELPIVQTATTKVTAYLHGVSGPSYPGYYSRPIIGGTRSQGLHGFNAVDLASPIGTPIYASAAGTVIVSSYGSWNHGYGNYIVISHPNGTQTLYAHASKLIATVGQGVSKGDLIALVGSTGKSTGPHVHFEIRGAKNPF